MIHANKTKKAKQFMLPLEMMLFCNFICFSSSIHLNFFYCNMNTAREIESYVTKDLENECEKKIYFIYQKT